MRREIFSPILFYPKRRGYFMKYSHPIGMFLACAIMVLCGSSAIATIDGWKTIDQLSYIAQGTGSMEGYSGLDKQVISGDKIQKTLNAYLVATGIQNLDTQTSSYLEWTENGIVSTEGFEVSKKWNFPQDENIAMLQNYHLQIYPENIQSPKVSWNMVVLFPQLSSSITPEQADLIKEGMVTEPGRPNLLTFDPNSVDKFFSQLQEQYRNSWMDVFGLTQMSYNTPHTQSKDGVTCSWGEKSDLELGVKAP
jgi:hypothetical protein